MNPALYRHYFARFNKTQSGQFNVAPEVSFDFE
jgi:hypothetical protein